MQAEKIFKSYLSTQINMILDVYILTIFTFHFVHEAEGKEEKIICHISENPCLCLAFVFISSFSFDAQVFLFQDKKEQEAVYSANNIWLQYFPGSFQVTNFHLYLKVDLLLFIKHCIYNYLTIIIIYFLSTFSVRFLKNFPRSYNFFLPILI